MSTDFRAGDVVRNFAKLYGWSLAPRVILVEGEHDKRYFELADRLYFEETGLALLGEDLTAFPTGIGDDGGVFGIQRHFHPLRAVMDRDLDANGAKIFHAVALFDFDMEGKKGANSLTASHLRFERWRDVFLLQRVLPRTSRSADELATLIAEANLPWQGLDCEIEDLVSLDLVEAFISENPNCLKKPVKTQGGGFHCEFHRHEKAKFIKYVEANSLLRDIESIVNLIKSMRYYLKLPPEGQPKC